MKAILTIFLIFLFGCSQTHSPSWFEKNDKIKVLSTTAMIDDLVGEIGGEHVDHRALIVGEVDPHSYELVKGDDEKIAFAHIVIGNGLNLEHGASLRYQLKQHRHVVFLGEEIQKRVPQNILRVEDSLDPHVWMDISLWAEGVDPIVAALILEDPTHAEDYKQNGEKLKQKMLQTHREIQQELRRVPAEKRFLVTSHDAFHYFTRAYLQEDSSWEERCVAPEGLAPEGQLSCQDIQRVVDHLCQHKIAVVFPESNVSRDALKKITSSCAHKVRICSAPLYGDAMGMPGSEADNYLGMIRHNAKVLGEEWTK